MVTSPRPASRIHVPRSPILPHELTAAADHLVEPRESDDVYQKGKQMNSRKLIARKYLLCKVVGSGEGLVTVRTRVRSLLSVGSHMPKRQNR